MVRRPRSTRLLRAPHACTRHPARRARIARRLVALAQRAPRRRSAAHCTHAAHHTSRLRATPHGSHPARRASQAARRLIPLLDRVLVKRIEAPSKSIGGVLLPESAQSKLNEGIVLSVGPGKRDKDGALLPMGVKVDDKVLLPQYGGNEVTIDDEEVVLFRDDDILGVLK